MKNNGVKLLAAVAVLALAVCSFAIIGFEQTDGEETTATPITDKDGFTNALVNGGNYKVSNNITDVVLENNIAVSKNTVIDLDGKKITITGGHSIAIQNSTLTIKSTNDTKGEIAWTGFQSTSNKGSTSAFSIGAAGSVVFEKIKVDCDGTVLFPNGNASNVTVRNSEIIAATYAIGTNYSESSSNSLTVTVDGGSILTSKGEVFTGTTGNNDDCTVMINIPGAKLNITDSTINGNRMALFVRGGEATLTDVTINYTGAYSNDTTSWGSGNNVPKAAVVLGDHSTTYNGAASLTINGGIIKATTGKALTTYTDSNTSISLMMGNTKAVDVIVGQTGGADNKITVSNLKVTSEGFNIIPGSIAIQGSNVVQSGSTITVVSGTASLVSDIPAGTKVVINNGATLNVPSTADVTVAGSITNNGTITNGGDLTTTGSVVNNGTITNSANKTITITGTYSGNAIANNATGTVKVPAGTNPSDIANGGNIQTSTDSGSSFGMTDELESDYTVKTSAFLSQDLKVPKGITLTVEGTLDLKGHILTVEGKLVITSKGSIVGDIDKNGTGPAGSKTISTIKLTETGVIENKGIIGANSFVTVEDAQTDAATVKMKNITGVQFSLTKVVSNGVNYVLTVSGDVSKKGTEYGFEINGAFIDGLNIRDIVNVEAAEANAANSTPAVTAKPVTITGATVVKDGQLTIGSKAVVKLSGTAVTLNNGAVMTIDGTVVPGTQNASTNTTDIVYMKNGAVVNMNGVANNVNEGTDSNAKIHSIVFQAKTGNYNTYDGNGARVDPEANRIISTTTSVVIDKLSGITLEVTSKAFMVDTTAKTEQMLNIAGTPAFTKTGTNNASETSGTITVSGTDSKVYVPAGEDLVLADGMTITGEVVVNGTIKSAVQNVAGYIGTEYVTKVTPETGAPYDLYTYTTFDVAFAAIDTAEDKTVTIRGGYEFDKSFTVKANQTVEFGMTGDVSGAKYTVSKDATITVEKDGTLSNGFFAPSNGTTDAAGIQGIVIVNDGATCTPADKSYEVMSKDADDNITYSGAAIAIENAQPGSTIYIVDTVTFKDKVTIPKDVTVDVASTATINAQKGLVVDGTIDNEGAVNINKNSDLVVAGIINNEGTVSFNELTTGAEATGQATITGKFVGTITGADKINAANYQDGTDIIYTSVDAAVKAVAQMDVMSVINVTGKFSENTDATLADGMIINIKGDITLSSVRLVAGSNLNIDDGAALTADIVGAVGKADTTGAVADAIVDVSKLEDAAFTLTYNESNTTYTMVMTLRTGYTGDVKVAQGSVDLANNNADLTFNENKTLSIASGATLVVNKDDLAFTDQTGDKKYFSNEGVLSVKKDMSITNAVIGGEVVVAVEKELTVITSTIAGTITLSESADKTPAKLILTGIVRIGSAPETLGAAGTVSGDIDFVAPASGNTYAIVYAGSTFDDKADADTVKSTKYVINGIDYATIYTEATSVNALTALTDEICDLDDLAGKKENGTNIDIEWYANGYKVTSATVGQYDVITTTIAYSTVDVKVSAAPGLTVYIDNLKADTTEKLAIGTHTITVYLDPNYQGTPAVTFNGKTISGSFEITTDMMDGENIISATGATYVAPGTGSGSSSSSSDDGMSITDILLIVLVVLIVIMAVLVAIRMMRS